MTQACDHRHNAKLIAATQAFTPENRLYSWWALTSTLALVAAAIGLNLFASHDGAMVIPIWGRLALSVLTGLLMVRLFVINHDYLHRAILTDSRGCMGDEAVGPADPDPRHDLEEFA